MSVEAGSLVEVKDVQLLLGSRGTGQERLLELIIAGVSAELKSHTARSIFVSTLITQSFDGDGTPTLHLPEYPILSVQSLIGEEGGAALTLGQDFVVWKPAIGIIKLKNSVFPRSIHGITCQWTAGYTVLPADLRKSILEACAFKFQEADKGAFLTKTEIKGPMEVVQLLKDPYPPSVVATWERYRAEEIW